MRKRILFLSLTVACLGCVTSLDATITATISSSVASPQALGTSITWTAAAVDSNPNPVTYRFEVAPSPYTNYTVLQDYSTDPTFAWVESYVEGMYKMRVTARDYTSGEKIDAISQPFQINPLATGTQGVVTATANPLVALLSAPTCPTGTQMRVAFQRAGAQIISYTDYRPCHAGTMNVYVAGMAESSNYTLYIQRLTNGVMKQGPAIPFTTGAIPQSVHLTLPEVVIPASNQTDQQYKVSLSSYASSSGFYAADLTGEVVWYYPVAGQLVRTFGPTLIMNTDGAGTGTGPYGVQTRQQALREFDLAGNIVHQTNADRISEQLVAMGTDPVGRFNHDAVRLANGHTLALTDAQRSFPAGTQGSKAPIDVIGEIIVELDENFQVVWFWNSFDHDGGGAQLDINRASLIPGNCAVNAQGQTPVGCPPGLLPGFKVGQDWLHANGVQLLADGNIMLSLRNQNWIIKIDYENGAVLDGSVLWRLGNGGDFTIVSNDSYPWFSGQHNPGFSSPTSLALFDNGNTRIAQDGGHSRGMAFTVDETNFVVTTVVSADLGVVCNSQGSAQLLPNGDYLFQPGVINGGSMESLEVTATAPNPAVFDMKTNVPSYRTFRMPDMYTPPYGTAMSVPDPPAEVK